MPAELPSGTVTLLFTDIEGSTRMLQQLGREDYVRALSEHRRLLREAFTTRGGVEVEMQGDSFFFAFPYAREAVAAAVEAQRALAEHAWEHEPITVRIGLHTGEPMIADGLYAGLDVHHAARIMSAAHGGQVILSHRTAELVTGELPDGIPLHDLGEHRLKDLTAPQRLLQAGDGDFPPLKTLRPQSNLPIAASPLVGRETELAQLTDLLRNCARVVTVTGAGGTGKTRLALQAAAELMDDFHDGAFWAPLSGLRDPDLVESAIARAVGASAELAEHLRSRSLLLLLDNFEHLLPAAPSIARLLAIAPRLHVLVTSRSPLRVAGEREFALDPLDEAAAVTLFLERARAAGAPLDRTAAVTEICRRLDHLPLALELAAARARLLGAETVLARLDRRLPLLTGGRRDAPERHRTLQATIDWSYRLLDATAQTLFARLAVFAGPFSLEAAEDIAEADVDTLASLVDASLLKPVGNGRFLMLETIREYAAAQLERVDDALTTRDRHADWFHRLAHDAAPELRGKDQGLWFARLEDDLDNLRAAFDHAEAEQALEMAVALGDFWIGRGHYREADRLLNEVLQRHPAPTASRAEGLRVAAEVATGLGDHERSIRLSEEAIELCNRLQLHVLAGRCLNNRGGARLAAGDIERADADFAESAAVRRREGDAVGAARAEGNRAVVALERGDHARAKAILLETLSFFEQASDSMMVAATLEGLGSVALKTGDAKEARRRFRQSVEVFAALGAPEGLAIAIEGLAAAETADNDAARAALLLGAADALRELSGASPAEPDRVRREHTWSTAALAFGWEEATKARARGGVMSLDDAVAAALGEGG